MAPRSGEMELRSDAGQDDGALTAQLRYYRALFDSIDEGLCIIEVMFDPTGSPSDYRFVEVNPAFEKQTGIVNAAGRSIREIAPGHEQYWYETYGRVARSGAPIRFVQHAQALGRWFNVYAFRVGAPAENRVGVLFSDFTEQRRAEHALLAADRRKDEFIATLAHELRNPLVPLRNGTEILRRASDAPTVRRTLDMMERQLTHIVRLVDDLLDIGRVHSGKLELRLAPLDLRAVLASSVEATSATMEARRHTLKIHANDEQRVLGDFDRLAQVVTNLLSNAAKYTEPGGQIQLELGRDRGDAVVTVSDSGIGIPPAELEQVFDLFTQVRAHQAHTGGGLGIGLSLVRSLVTLHGGAVEARSPGLGRGSTFAVRLPLIEAALASDRNAGEPVSQ